jgi:hypothetical protein
MAMNSSSNDDAPLPSVTNKKPYEKPGFRYEPVFVTTAFGCGKADPFSSNCQGNLKNS